MITIPRITKCQFCQIKNKVEKIKGVHPVGYLCKECVPAYEEDKKFKTREREELDCLTDTIVKIHRLQSRASVPKQIFPLLQDIRNDSVLFGKIEKNYKLGLSYSLISETYEYCKDKIEWAKSNKQFKNVISELKYCLAIVKNNFEDVIRDKKKRKNAKVEEDKLRSKFNQFIEINKIIKNNKINNQKEESHKEDDDIDLTSLLD